MLLALLTTLRPKQWVKNIFVAAPLLFALKLTDTAALLQTATAVALFCLISGCVYVLNDLVDVEADRRHPRKRLRPIASGALSVGAARAFLGVATPSCVALSFWLSPAYGATLTGYFVANLAYSFRLKHVAYLDVLIIAGLFILRVLAGSYAIDVEPSLWLIACTFLLATFLGFGKRAHELAAGSDAHERRAALARYRLDTLRWTMHALAVMAVVVYVLYTRSEHTVELFRTTSLVYTVPFPIFGILRFIHLATTRHEAESPTEEMLTDPWFMLNLVAYAGMVVAILYVL